MAMSTNASSSRWQPGVFQAPPRLEPLTCDLTSVATLLCVLETRKRQGAKSRLRNALSYFVARFTLEEARAPNVNNPFTGVAFIAGREICRKMGGLLETMALLVRSFACR
jgi:hypothetical protein